MAGTKFEEAKRSLVQFIREGQLAVGDRLPSHAALRERLKLSTSTIHAAIGELREEGVLEVRDKVGVFLKDPGADGHVARVIGLAAFEVVQNSAFNCYLVHSITRQLAERGYQTHLFCSENGPMPLYHSFDDIPGLERCIRERKIDAMLALCVLADECWEEMRQQRLPMINFSSTLLPHGSFGIDWLAYLRDALKQLALRRIRRVGILVTGSNDAEVDEFRAASRRLPEAVRNDMELEVFFCSPGAICDRIFSRPCGERPEALISLDDILMRDLVTELYRRRQWDYQPHVVHLTNRQLPVPVPFEHTLHYEVDLDELAGVLVEALLRDLQTRNGDGRPELYGIRAVSACPEPLLQE